ncbi:MAG: VOC family protein [Chitinophagales bacterium]|nr:VOC family protein [Chitinophagales bacterium]
MLKIEHLGIVVKDLEASNALFTKLLNREPYKMEEVPNSDIVTSFFMMGESKIELFSSETPDIQRYLEKKGEGIHHIAFLVDDLQSEIDRLISEGFKPIMKEPARGADNKMVFFFHPKSTNGVLLELCAEIDAK